MESSWFAGCGRGLVFCGVLTPASCVVDDSPDTAAEALGGAAGLAPADARKIIGNAGSFTWEALGVEYVPTSVESAETVYEVTYTVNEQGVVADWQEQGTWSLELEHATAYSEAMLAEGWAYEEVAWHDAASGLTGYRVTRRPVEVPDPGPPTRRTGIGDSLATVIENAEPDELIPVTVRVDVPAADPPPVVPHPTTLSAADHAAAKAARAAWAMDRKAQFASDASALVTGIEADGGQVVGHLWTIGWLAAVVRSDAVEKLLDRPDVVRITLDSIGPDGASDPVPLGDLATHTGSRAYEAAGYHGEPSHNNEYLMAIVEGNPPEDDACFFADGTGCNPNAHLRNRFTCTSSSCSHTTNYSEADEKFHGTHVASIALGDYENGQGSSHESEIAGGLGAGWRSKATGYARAAELHYMWAGSQSARVKAYECAADLGGPSQCAKMDVLNASHGHTDGWCDMASQEVIEAGMEVLPPVGTFPVAITHNYNSNGCWVASPADIPRAFAVGAIDPDDSSAYATWQHASYSSRGPGDTQIGIVVKPDANSIVDLVAPGWAGYVTDPAGTYGQVLAGGIVTGDGTKDEGTSYAAPQVSGAAIQVLHRWGNIGWNFPRNNARWMQAIMLGMGDRATMGTSGATASSCIHPVDSSRIFCGADVYYGLGRLKLRFHNLHWHRSLVFTSTSQSWSEIAFNQPLPGDTKIVKCTLQQDEPMANKVDISGVELRATIRAKVGSSCSTSGAPVAGPVVDALPDDKHMVAFLDSDSNLGNQCLHLQVSPLTIASNGFSRSYVYCYSDNELDY